MDKNQTTDEENPIFPPLPENLKKSKIKIKIKIKIKLRHEAMMKSCLPKREKTVLTAG